MMNRPNPHLNVIRVFAMLLFGAVLVSSNVAFGQAQKEEPKLTLRAIMSELGAEYLRLTNALLLDDFNGLEKSAKAIQEHPLPEGVAGAIKNKLGKNFPKFERVDEQAHRAAGDLVKRAVAKDISGSAKALGRLTESCVSCHKEFRATLRPLSD